MSSLDSSVDLSGYGSAPSAGAVVHDALRAQVANFRALEPGVRAAEPEAVADMRVSTRQLRSTIRGFARVLNPHATRAPAKDLKWLAAQIAGERDVQVLIQRFAEDIRLLPDCMVVGPVIEDMRAVARLRVEEGERTAVAALDSARYRELLGRLTDLTTSPPFTHRAERPANVELSKCLASAVARFDRLLDRARGMTPGPDRDKRLHEARKADKQVRYMSEVLIPVVDKPARRLRHHSEKLQKLLGENQDSVMARSTLVVLADYAHARGHSTFTYGLLYGVEHQRAEQSLEALPDRLNRLHDAKTISWLDPAVT